MRTVAVFRYKGRMVYIRGYSQSGPYGGGELYTAHLDGQEIPVPHGNVRELEAAMRGLIDEITD